MFVPEWISYLLIVSTDLTDVTLVSDDTYGDDVGDEEDEEYEEDEEDEIHKEVIACDILPVSMFNNESHTKNVALIFLSLIQMCPLKF